MASKENQTRSSLQEIMGRLNDCGAKCWLCGFNKNCYFKKYVLDINNCINDLELLQQQKQISDVEKIADNEREMNAIEKISKLEKALDKACERLSFPNIQYKDDIKQDLLKESEKE